jgi:hypothetical protein
VHSGLATRPAVYFPQFPLGRAREPFSYPEMDF